MRGTHQHLDGRIERLTRGKVRLPKGQTLPPEVWERRHRRVKQLLWLHALGVPLFGLLMTAQPLPEALLAGAALAALALLTKLSRDRRFRAAVASVGMLTSSALLVHATNGAVEAQFHFFVVISVLTLYEDWIPFFIAVAYVVVHHGVMGTIAPGQIYSDDEPFKWALIHGAFVLAAGFVNVTSWRMNEELRSQTAAESRRRAEAEAVAVTLQQSLRPERLPSIEGAELSARYIPAGTNAIGGDWYDMVEVPGGLTLVAIGDVAGHGVQAASSTAQLRHSFRAYALEGYGPAEIARRLDVLFDGDFATFACVALDTAAGRLSYANAGHLPPLVVSGDGSTSFLDRVCPPLGTVAASSFDEYEAPFEPGSTLLAYTDGLVERRGQPIREGLEELERAAARAHEDADELVEHVLAELDPQGLDDVAIVAFRAVPDVLRTSLRFTPDPRALARMRASVTPWLRQAGADADELHDLTLACGEACSNAIEHSATPELIELQLALEGSAIEVTVRDSGRWREGSPSRGRGLKLLHALTDEVELRPGPRGTTARFRRTLRQRA